MAPEGTTSVRIKKKIVSNASDIADKKGISLKAYLDDVILNANDEYNFSFNKLKDHVSKSISLALYRDTIEKEFNDAPVAIRKKIIEEIDNNQVFFFYNKFPEEKEKIINIFNKEIEHLLLFVKIKGMTEESPKELDKISELLEESNKGPKKIDLIIKGGCNISEGNFELMGFFAIKKEGENGR